MERSCPQQEDSIVEAWIFYQRADPAYQIRCLGHSVLRPQDQVETTTGDTN